MQITMVKKRTKDGNPCRKCSQAEQLLKDRNVWQYVHRVIWAEENDPSSEGYVIAERHNVTVAPFFLVRSNDGSELCVQNTLELLRLIQPRTSPTNQIDATGAELPKDDDAQGWVRVALERFGRECPIAFSGAEDVVLIDMASRTGRPFSVFCLDTGRLHAETYDLIERVRVRYGIAIDVVSPDTVAVQDLVKQKGLFSFYRDGHGECCGIRKVAPLRRILGQQRGWITGQRKDQSPDTRATVRSRARSRVQGSERDFAHQVQPACQLVVRAGVGIHSCQRCPLQPAARAGISIHRLPTLHARRRSWSARARRPMVVGRGNAKGMWLTRCGQGSTGLECSRGALAA